MYTHYECQKWDYFTKTWMTINRYTGDMASTLALRWFEQAIAVSSRGFRVIDHGLFKEGEDHECADCCWIVYAAFEKKIYISGNPSLHFPAFRTCKVKRVL